ncbi:hypothetical protein TRVL_03417 [Trypanosoma vivax]|nr:hypothetical protein TRVL_03417 [Trypanosoma vivax]
MLCHYHERDSVKLRCNWWDWALATAPLMASVWFLLVRVALLKMTFRHTIGSGPCLRYDFPAASLRDRCSEELQSQTICWSARAVVPIWRGRMSKINEAPSAHYFAVSFCFLF